MFTQSFLKRKSKVPESAMTPPMTTRSRSSSCSSFDEAYFAKTYVPLSSLPTPPLSSHSNSSRQQSPDAVLSDGALDPELFGPAFHLTNLIPSSTSLTTPSVTLVHAIITRADLPLEFIALAVCILDSLNSRFALQWRKNCPLIQNTFFSTWSHASTTSSQHIDSIHPEVIVLSALVLAVKFLDDAQQTTKEYAQDWGKGLWTCDQINYTQRCLLENLGYRILPLWNDSIIHEALEDMERAGRQIRDAEKLKSASENDSEWATCFGTFRGQPLSNVSPMSTGKAVMGFGQQLTPVETPLAENVRGTRVLSKETRDAFQTGRKETFSLPTREQEPFPAYEEPAVRAFELGTGMGWGI